MHNVCHSDKTCHALPRFNDMFNEILFNGFSAMVLDICRWIEGWIDGHREKQIPPSLAGDNSQLKDL